MKIKALLLIVAAGLFGVSCTPDYSEHTFRGILYTDSTKTAVVPNASMTFRESSGSSGKFTTDAAGRWGFTYIRNLDNPNQANTKLSYVEYELVIKCGDDTVYFDYDVPRGNSTSDTLASFPGYMDWLRSLWNDNNDTINNDSI